MDNAFNDSTNKSSKDLSISNDLKQSDWPLTFNLMNQLKNISNLQDSQLLNILIKVNILVFLFFFIVYFNLIDYYK